MISTRRKASALVCLAVVVVGCGGGSEDRDVAYVTDVCASIVAFQRASSVLKPENGGWDDDTLGALAAVYAEWADALDTARPPDDVREVHRELVDGVRTASRRLADGAAPSEAIRDLGEVVYAGEPAARLEAVARSVDDCASANFWFDRPIGQV